MSEFIKSQQELRANLTMQIRDVIESAEAENRGLDTAELEKIDRIEADIRAADESIEVATRNEQRKVEASVAAKGFVPTVSEERSASEILRGIALGEVRGHEFAKRATLVPSSNTVPKSFYDEVFDLARLSGPMLETSEVINTTSGEDLTIPVLDVYSVASLTAAGSAISQSEPTYNSITLGAKKYAFTIQAANELVQDAGFDLASHLARQAGNAIGYAVNSALTVGTGTTVPTGIVTAAGSGVTGGTGVAGAFTADALIDLAYSVDGAVRRLPSAGFMANGQTIGAMRKLKDTAGNYLYQVGVGYPDTFAGFRVVENPHVAAVGTGAKSVLFGALDSYKVRVAGGIQVASSQDYAFNQDLTTWRFLIRLDGNLTHAAHIKYFAGAAS
jgi:HK97 family phage major capsid protein